MVVEENGNGKYVTMNTYKWTVGGLCGIGLALAVYFNTAINDIKAARERNVQNFERRVTQLETELANIKGK